MFTACTSRWLDKTKAKVTEMTSRTGKLNTQAPFDNLKTNANIAN